jgi:ankyrin repeat protein
LKSKISSLHRYAAGRSDHFEKGDIQYLNHRDHKGLTAIDYTILNDQYSRFSELVALGAELSIPDIMGDLPIHFAVLADDVYFLREILIFHGLSGGRLFDINSRNTNGETALHLAVNEGEYIYVKLLLDAGCLPAIKNNKDRTALHLAAKCGNEDIASLILGYELQKVVKSFSSEAKAEFLKLYDRDYRLRTADSYLSTRKATIIDDYFDKFTSICREHEGSSVIGEEIEYTEIIDLSGMD